MIMNVLIIGIWLATTGLMGIGLWAKEKIEEKRRMKAREKLWLL